MGLALNKHCKLDLDLGLGLSWVQDLGLRVCSGFWGSVQLDSKGSDGGLLRHMLRYIAGVMIGIF